MLLEEAIQIEGLGGSRHTCEGSCPGRCRLQEVAARCDDICIIANGQVAIDDSIEGIRERTGEDDLEEAFVSAIKMVGEE